MNDFAHVSPKILGWYEIHTCTPPEWAQKLNYDKIAILPQQ